MCGKAASNDTSVHASLTHPLERCPPPRPPSPKTHKETPKTHKETPPVPIFVSPLTGCLIKLCCSLGILGFCGAQFFRAALRSTYFPEEKPRCVASSRSPPVTPGFLLEEDSRFMCCAGCGGLLYHPQTKRTVGLYWSFCLVRRGEGGGGIPYGRFIPSFVICRIEIGGWTHHTPHTTLWGEHFARTLVAITRDYSVSD